MDLSAICFLLAFFFSLYAGGYIYLWLFSPDEERKIITPKKIALGFILLYVALAHLSVLSGLAYGVERDALGGCGERLKNETTYYKYGNNYTGYHWDYQSPPENPPITDINLFHDYTTYVYENTCDDLATPFTLSVLYVLTSYLIYGGVLFLFIGSIYFVFRILAGNNW